MEQNKPSLNYPNINFENYSKEDWIQEALKKLKDQDWQVLASETYEGITLNPFYTAQDKIEPALPLSDLTLPHQWSNLEEIVFENPGQAQERMKEALEMGAEMLQLTFPQAIEAASLDVLHWPDGLPLGLKYHQNLVLPQSLNSNFLKFISYDKLASWTQRGNPEALDWDTFVDEIKQAHAAFPEAKVLSVGGGHFLNAGSNAVQELAFTLSAWVEYLHQLTERGFKIQEAVGASRLEMGIGANFFVELAKFRAMRILWRNILKAYQVPFQPCFLSAKTGLWNKSPRDAYNNILRSTTEAFSAILGNCDSCTVLPYDAHWQESSPFSRRIARNISSILKYEAHISKVSDAASGSYFVESLTRDLSQKAWGLFQELEAKGGFQAAFRDGFVSEEIGKVKAKRIENFRKEKDLLIGVNKFKNPQSEAEDNFTVAEKQSDHSASFPRLENDFLYRYEEFN